MLFDDGTGLGIGDGVGIGVRSAVTGAFVTATSEHTISSKQSVPTPLMVSRSLHKYKEREQVERTCDKLDAQYLFILVNRCATSSSDRVDIVGCCVGG